MRGVSRALALLTPRERVRGLQVLALIVLMALFEALGVLAIMPFLAVLADPGMIESHALLARLHAAAGAPETARFLMLLGAGALGLVVVGAAVRTVTELAINRFIQTRVHSFGVRLLQTYLRQPYPFFLQRHSGDLQRAILSEAEKVVQAVYWPGMLLVANGTVLVVLVALLVAVDPLVALGATVVLGSAYLSIYLAVRQRLRRIGAEGVAANQARFQATTEALGGIKGVRLQGAERQVLDRFAAPSEALARRIAASTTISHVPKYAIEAIGFGGILALALVLLARHGADGAALGQVLPLIGLYAFAGYRLLPAVQAVYRGFTMLRFGDAGLASVEADLRLGRDVPDLPAGPPPALLPLRQALRLERVSFAYPGGSGAGLHGIDLTVPAGARVGIVGRTGSGKTTLVDVILGLLTPDAGQVLVDGAALTPDRLRGWQRAIGYVPQDIFLRDGTIAENIAFGADPDDIDPAAIERAARLAQLHDFVTTELQRGYETRVGERGVRLSGGQRQRIGIARALYHDPTLLVFDEATSALDNETERLVMDAIAGLGGDRTVLMIAHRLSTVRDCDMILVLEGGRLAGLGRYEDLLADNDAFRRIAAAADAAPDAKIDAPPPAS